MIINPADIITSTKPIYNYWNKVIEVVITLTHTPTNTVVSSIEKNGRTHLAKEQAFKELQERLKDAPEQLELF